MEVLQRIGLRHKTSLNLRSGFLIKSLQNSQELVVIGCLTLNSRREKELINLMKSQLVKSVARSTMVIALRGRIIVLVVVKTGTIIGISLMLGVKTRVVVKLKRVVQMRLQRRTAFILSTLGVSKRLLPTW